MTGKPTSEKAFEDAIESHLVDRAGYTKADNRQFDPELALDKHTLLAFLKETQSNALNALKASYGTHLEDAVVKRITTECDKRGLLDVVRNGVRDRGQHLHLSYFRPPTRLNPETDLRYRQNRLTVMRQVRYDPDSNHTIRSAAIAQRPTHCHRRTQKRLHRPAQRSRHSAVQNPRTHF